MSCIQYIISLRAIAMEATFIQPLREECARERDILYKTHEQGFQNAELLHGNAIVNLN